MKHLSGNLVKVLFLLLAVLALCTTVLVSCDIGDFSDIPNIENPEPPSDGEDDLLIDKNKIYTISFMVDGALYGTQTYSLANTNVFIPAVPAKPHYTGAWEPFSLTGGNLTVNAVYTPIPYTVTFVANGTTVATRTYTVEDTSISEPVVPAKDDCSGVWESYSLTGGDITVNAVYAPKVYTVTFMAGTATVATETFTAENMEITEPPVPEKNGYLIVGWEEYTLSLNNITVNAVYTPIPYTITFVAEGVTIDTLTYTVESKEIVEPAVPAKEFYIGSWEPYSLIGGNMIINAVYTLTPYTVTFIAGNVVVATETFNAENMSVKEPSVPERDGYIIVGWEEYTLSLNNITVNAVYDDVSMFTFKLLEDGSGYEISAATPLSGDIILPETYHNNLPVTGISPLGFYECSEMTSITIPKSILRFGTNAFSNCTELTAVHITDLAAWCQIDFGLANANPLFYAKHLYLNGTEIEGELTIPDGVTGIGSGAFIYCVKLTSVTLPESVKSIGSDAFSGCSGLKTFTIPKYVTEIANGTFSGCTGLTSISILGSVTRIGSLAFYGCTGLSSITIPNSVMEIGILAFSGCTGLASIDIPNNVKTIYEFAFQGCSNLASVSIGDGVTSIGIYAFVGCSKLTAVHITDLATWCQIEFGDFQANPLFYGKHLYLNEEELTGDLIIPVGVKKIGNYAFYGYSGLTSVTIPDGVTTIGKCAFSRCTGITSVIIPSSVANIGSAGFYYCSKLTSVYINDIAAWCQIKFGDIDANPLYYTKQLYLNGTEFTGDLVLPDGITTINDYAFCGFDKLTSVTIPNSVTTVGTQAFTVCPNLASVIISGSNTDIGYRAFHNCSNLTSVTFNTSAAKIGNEAFFGCTNLIQTEAGVQYVDKWAIDCDTSVTSVTLRDDTVGIGYQAFAFCYELTSITIPNSVKSIDHKAFFQCSALTSIVIPDSVTSIGSWAFYDCTGLTSVIISNNITTIESCAFYYCSALTSIVIPDSVTTIERSAFSDCSSLTSIVIPGSVTTIEPGAFSGCDALVSILVDEGNPMYHSVENCIIETATGTLISGCKTSIIPNDGSITTIGDYAFHWCSGLTSVSIPDGVTSIGSCAFSGCTGLTAVTIPDSVTSIGSSAFSTCTGLTSVTIGDGVTEIGYCAFQDCTGLTSISIPKSVIYLGSSAFSGCTNLIQTEAGVQYVDKWAIDCDTSVTSVILRADTVGIGDSAFSSCTALTSVTIPDQVITIGNQAFYNCSALLSVTIGKSVTTIGDTAFIYCNQLTSLVLPDSLTVLGENTFYGCFCLIQEENGVEYVGKWVVTCNTSPVSIALRSNSVGIGEYAFYSCSELVSIVIPESVINIGFSAFGACSELTTVYYTGTAEEWDAISIDSKNDELTSATRYYYSETRPTEAGNRWHYVDGVPTIW